ncbi:hypothetical protein M413DRAFT_439568 [Hebeloma cylindrosporum]|uniref:Urease accessory protein UreD n=1 Tax=Hebeloma cylindrosporum TaxID=76867 RepID=A0A0C2YDK9_HEBCY|nr:hypothetical protein M413DRAFT_439568 [Hebeloma cylindrosporum h7]
MPEPQLSHITKLRAGGGCITVSILGEKAVFSELSSTYPLKLLSQFIQDTRAIAYLLTYGGGLVSGDEIGLVVNVQLGATLILLSQGSTKVFKARPGKRLASVKSQHLAPLTLHPKHPGARTISTRQNLDFHIAPRSILLLLPEPVTCFRDAHYRQSQRFHIQGDGSIVILDWITSGRISLGEEWAFSHYYSMNELFHNEKRIAKDVMLLDKEELGDHLLPNRSLRERLQPYSCYAMLILFGPEVQSVIAAISARYDKISIFKGVVVRMAGIETEMVKGWLREALYGLESIIGVDVYRRTFP